ncbi:MAG: 2-hydroxyacid dehydrogenase [Desulfomonilaceae bacterium]
MKALVTGNLPKEIIATLRVENEVAVNSHDGPMPRDEILANIRDKDGLLCMVTDRIDDELMEKAPNLRIVANYGVGYDNIDLPAATARGIWVTNTPGVLTEATADLTFALILGLARRIVEGEAMIRAGEWKSWAPLLFLGTEVSGKTLGIIGLGQIGKAVARRALGFDMRIIYHNRRRIDEKKEKELNVTYVPLEELLSEADFVSLHVTLTNETRHLIGFQELSHMKPTAYLINASRGPVVDERALVEALLARKIAGAGLDVYENEPALTPGLLELNNVLLLPHVGSATIETRTAMAKLAAENLLDGLRGVLPRNCLNCVER